MDRRISSILTCAVVVSTMAFFINPAFAHPAAQKFAALYKEALEATKKANQILVGDIDAVAETLSEFVTGNERFPNQGDDLASLSLELNVVVKPNPFAENNQSGQRVEIIYDPSIDERQVRKLKVEAPTNWQAKAGTIVAITNGSDFCIVWAAGNDGLPVRNSDGQIEMRALKVTDD